MKQTLHPVWPRVEIEAGRKMHDAWERFFAAADTPGGAGVGAPGLGAAAEAEAVLRHHERDLLAYPNVVGVATGIAMRAGRPTGEPCITVFVARKLPEGELPSGDVLPKKLDGIVVDVIETGAPEAL